jgi:hypothetical protein
MAKSATMKVDSGWKLNIRLVRNFRLHKSHDYNVNIRPLRREGWPDRDGRNAPSRPRSRSSVPSFWQVALITPLIHLVPYATHPPGGAGRPRRAGRATPRTDRAATAVGASQLRLLAPCAGTDRVPEAASEDRLSLKSRRVLVEVPRGARRPPGDPVTAIKMSYPVRSFE